jgi:endonuclease/exonuclease/phosphatase family metal-dependent hydrolase
VVAGLGLAVQTWSVLPLLTGGSDETPDLTVMTANLEFGKGDAVTVVRTVAEEEVDVLVLEEVTPTGYDALLAVGLVELLPHQAGEPVTGAAGTLVLSRYPLAESRSFTLRNGGLDVDVAAPEPFRLLAVHTAQPVDLPDWWVTDMATVRRRAAEAVDEGPTLVVGDFNATRDHQPLRAILGTGLRDAAEQAGSGWQPTWPTRFRTSWLQPLITIDHVLTSKEYVATGTRTVEVRNSDHLALLADLRLSNR